MGNQNKDTLKIVGLISIGIVIGMALSWIFIFISVDSFVNNILPKVHVENIIFELNETALVEGMNNTFGTSKTIFNEKDRCKPIPCECHEWGCALYCMECEEDF